MPFRTWLCVALVVTLTSCGTTQTDESVLLAGQTDQLKPLPLLTDRASFCGVESYASKADPACGVALYREDRSAACGVQAYNARADMSCPGSITEHRYDATVGYDSCNSKNPGEPAGCNGGYVDEGIGDTTRSCRVGRPQDGNWETFVVARARHCHRPQYAATCRKPEFGVEAYNSCRHANHGVERYNTCALPQFGVATYKACSFYLKPEETSRFLTERTNSVAQNAMSLVNGRGIFATESQDEVALACLIKAYDGDPLYAEIVTDLKSKFVTTTGLIYDAVRYDCKYAQPASPIESYSCPDSSASNKCRAWRIWAWAKNWLEVTRQDASHVKGDVGARLDDSLRRSAEDLDAHTAGILAKDASITGGQ